VYTGYSRKREDGPGRLVYTERGYALKEPTTSRKKSADKKGLTTDPLNLK
jgi:hypothetical protein